MIHPGVSVTRSGRKSRKSPFPPWNRPALLAAMPWSQNYAPLGGIGVSALVAALPGTRMHWVEAGDHFFAGALEAFEAVVEGL